MDTSNSQPDTLRELDTWLTDNGLPADDEPQGYCWVCADEGHTAGQGCATRAGMW